MSERLKPKRGYPLKALTGEVASKLHQVGSKLPNRTLLDDLYCWQPQYNWDPDFRTNPPAEWVAAINELTPPQKGAVSGALRAAIDSDLTFVGQLRVPFEQLLHTNWTFGRARIEFLRQVFSTDKPENPHLRLIK